MSIGTGGTIQPGEKKSDELFQINWKKDKKIIETALKEAKVFTERDVYTGGTLRWLKKLSCI